jgi:hypothetical protein
LVHKASDNILRAITPEIGGPNEAGFRESGDAPAPSPCIDKVRRCYHLTEIIILIVKISIGRHTCPQKKAERIFAMSIPWDASTTINLGDAGSPHVASLREVIQEYLSHPAEHRQKISAICSKPIPVGNRIVGPHVGSTDLAILAEMAESSGTAVVASR